MAEVFVPTRLPSRRSIYPAFTVDTARGRETRNEADATMRTLARIVNPSVTLVSFAPEMPPPRQFRPQWSVADGRR